MHDELRDRGMHELNVRELNILANALTEGMRELPTDFAARVKNFLGEYVGSPGRPVPFGGRGREFEELDSWLKDEEAEPYILLAAPAGRGKSALLLRWCQRLLGRREVAVAYFPVSIRFRTNLAGVAFPALVALLAQLHGEKAPGDPNVQEEVWRGLLVEYMTRPLPDGRMLVVVLDGVDEAADWSVSGLFPGQPADSLRVVISARYLVHDRDAGAWLERLGWMQKGLAKTLQLFPLDRAGIASVLVQMGFPVDTLSTRVDVVSELHRLSEGDPLLVRLYVDDLWERGEVVVRLQPEDLRAIRPGLVGYFERWWTDQRMLWSGKAPEREATIDKVLHVLAGALGPLSRQDILVLVQGEEAFHYEIDEHLRLLGRFVIGDGRGQGYVFSHPRLANYFLEERLSAVEREEVEGRFLAWGKSTLMALNEGRLRPEEASSYIVQYYGAHLECWGTEGSAGVEALLELVSDGWRRAWEKLDRANAGFLDDVERAWKAAEREDLAAIGAGREVRYVGELVRCLLCRVSVNNMASNISPKLMLEAVKTGIWTPAQGLANIRLIGDLAPRARELVELATYVQEPLRGDILQEAVDTVEAMKSEYERLDTLVELAPRLSRKLLPHVLDSVASIEDDADRAGVLADLAPTLALADREATLLTQLEGEGSQAATAVERVQGGLLERAMEMVEVIEEEELCALALEGIAACCQVGQQERVKEMAGKIGEERYRVQVYKALISRADEALMLDILEQARGLWDGLSRVRLLAELAISLTGPEKLEAIADTLELVRDLDDREYRVEVLVKLAALLPEDAHALVLREAQLLWDEGQRARALSDLVPYIPEMHLPEVVETVLALRSEEHRTTVLRHLVLRLPENLLEQVLESTREMWDEGCKVEILAVLGAVVPDSLLSREIKTALAVRDRGYRIWLMAELEVLLYGRLQESYLENLQKFWEIGSLNERVHVLMAIAPRLSDAALEKIFAVLLPELFGFVWKVLREDQRANILIKLGPRLPEEWLGSALVLVSAIGNEVYQAPILVAMAERIRGLLLSDALNIVRAMKERARRAEVLEALVSCLPQENKAERVQEMLQTLQVIKDERERAQVAARCMGHLEEMLPDAIAKNIVQMVADLREEKNRASLLEVLVVHLPESCFENVLKLGQRIANEEIWVRFLSELVPFVPEYCHPQFLSEIQRIGNERLREKFLEMIVLRGSEQLFGDLLELMDVQGEYERARIAAVLAPHVPGDAFASLWKVFKGIRDDGRRVWVLGSLASRAPASFFEQVWEEIMAVNSEGWQMRIVGRMAQEASESLFERMCQAVREIANENRRAVLLWVLAGHVPEELFDQVWGESQRITDFEMCINVWRVLALRVPEAYFGEMLSTVKKANLGRQAMTLLVRLAERVPEEFFEELFEDARLEDWHIDRERLLLALAGRVPKSSFGEFLWEVDGMLNKIIQGQALARMAAHVPVQEFEHFWSVVEKMGDEARQIDVIKAFLPYVSRGGMANVLKMWRRQIYGEYQVSQLEVLVPHLSEFVVVALLEMVWMEGIERFGEKLPETWVVSEEEGVKWESRWYLRALAVLLPYLPQEKKQAVMPQLLRMGLNMKVMEDRLWILKRMAAEASEEMVGELLDAALGVEPLTISVVAALLAKNWRPKVLAWAGENLRKTGKVDIVIQVCAASGTIREEVAVAVLYPIVQESLRLLAHRTRWEADFTPLVAAIRVLGGEEAVRQVCYAALEIGSWWP